MAVLYVLLFIVVAALYLGYLALAVPIAAIFAFVVYGLGMPTAYFVGLWRVLVPYQATFARLTMRRRRGSAVWRFRQAM